MTSRESCATGSQAKTTKLPFAAYECRTGAPMHLRFFMLSREYPLITAPLPPTYPPDHGRIARSGRLAEPQPYKPAWIRDKPLINGGGNSSEI